MMSTVLRVRVWWVLTALSACLGWAVVSWGQDAAAAKPGILTREQAAAIMPATVFYRGQSATIQGRNSSGIRMAGGKLMLAAVVDTGGYSTAVQQSYQAYLITEIPLDFDGKLLPPGAYGFGFVAPNRMVVMDVGANQIFEAKTQRDTVMARPNPLQILPDAAPGRYRLYMGRTYVVLAPQGKM